MNDYVTFNGKRSDSLGLAVLTTSRPLLPENKDEYVEMPCFDGTILIPDKSKRDIVVTIEFLVRPSSNLFDVCRSVAAWLDTDDRAPLIFQDDPSFAYQAKVSGNVEMEKIARMGKFEVQFRCLPHTGVALTP